MTSNEETIKTLEDMIKFADMVNRSVLDAVDVQMLKNILDLIKHQNADIERLKEVFRYLERLEKENESLNIEVALWHADFTYKLAKAKTKAEAREEFAEKLKEKSWDVPYETEDAHFVQVVDVGDIDNVLKELSDKERKKYEQ